MTKNRYVMANWKMNMLADEGLSLARDIIPYIDTNATHIHTILCPSTVILKEISEAVGDVVALGAQDCHAEKSGAFTGNVSAPMVKEAGASYVIVGHSERREYHGETDADVAAKTAAADSEGLVPVVCVGEHLADREAGIAIDVVSKQLLGSIPDGIDGPFFVAYEPIWAIGTGKVPTTGDIESMHNALMMLLTNKCGVAPENAYILYGGSVKASNAEEIFALPSVGGVLVGGASLVANEFGAIIQAASNE